MQIVLLILGIFYIVRRPKITRLRADDFPKMPPEVFDQWRRLELRSISEAAPFMRVIRRFVVEFNEGNEKNPLTELDSSAAKGLSPCLIRSKEMTFVAETTSRFKLLCGAFSFRS